MRHATPASPEWQLWGPRPVGNLRFRRGGSGYERVRQLPSRDGHPSCPVARTNAHPDPWQVDMLDAPVYGLGNGITELSPW